MCFAASDLTVRFRASNAGGKSLVVFILTVPRWFFCYSSLFMRRWEYLAFALLLLFVPHLSCVYSSRKAMRLVTYSGYFHLYFGCLVMLNANSEAVWP